MNIYLRVFLNEVVRYLAWCLAYKKNIRNISWLMGRLMDTWKGRVAREQRWWPPSLGLFDITTELCRGPGVLVDFFFLETLSGVII